MVAASPIVPTLARRLGAVLEPRFSVVRLTQVGEMWSAPHARAMRFRARQSIDVRSPAFRWEAITGPFGCISVTDSFATSAASLEIKVLRFFSLARLGGSAATKGAAMRYLAELAWAPDALLQNSALHARAIDPTTMRVGLSLEAGEVGVELRLDAQGRIASAFVADRPRQEGSGFVERPWRGRFFDYREYLSRWIPFRAEAEWILEGRAFVTWRGEITSWALS